MPNVIVRVLTSFHSAPVLRRIWILVACTGLYASGVVMLERTWGDWLNWQSSLHTQLGLVLGLLLVFRTNTAYDRWWEGRKLWGQLVNDSRNLAIKIQTCVQADQAQKRRTAQWLVAFAYALKDHLRGGGRLADHAGFEPGLPEPPHVPLFIAESIYQRIESWRQAELLGGFELLFLDRHARSLMDVCGACERIRKTPISASWIWFVRQAVFIYLVTLPWGLAHDFGLFCIPLVVVVAYFMIGVETIAEDVEEPFGLDEDDLMLDEICLGIRTSVLSAVPEA